MDYKKTILYAATIVVAMLLWNKWQQEHTQRTLTKLNSAVPAAATTPSTPTETATAKQATSTQSVSTQTAATPDHKVVAPEKRLLHVDTDTLRVTIDTLGGRIVGVSLPQYPTTLHGTQPFMLLNESAQTHYSAIAALTGFGDDGKLLQYSAAKANYTLDKNQRQLNVVLQARTAAGVQVTKIFTFRPDSYLVDVAYAVTNRGDKAQQGSLSLQISRTDIKPPHKNTFQIHSFYGFALSTPQHHYQTYKFSALRDQNINQTANRGWVGMTQHYFVSAWIPSPGADYRYFSRVDNGLYTVGAVAPAINVAPGQTADRHEQFYVGPKITGRLDAAAPYLSKTIDYGWLWPISLLIFWLMKHIFSLLGNWGLAIILVTALIKLVFWPLSAKSYRSMAGMRTLQPKVTALKDRLGDDKQQFGREMMALYKREKINPLGGCLPILIQIPFFIALYWVLIATIQLRQAPFMLWVQDLSAADPYYVLPILMGASMFLQQRLSPPPPDPMQAKVMMFLPVFITAIFLRMPSGLLLYMLVNNLISIGQQWWVTKRYEKHYKNRRKAGHPAAKTKVKRTAKGGKR